MSRRKSIEFFLEEHRRRELSISASVELWESLTDTGAFWYLAAKDLTSKTSSLGDLTRSGAKS